MRRGEAAVALGLLAVALYVGVGAWRMPRGTWALPGPGLFPGIVAGLLAMVAVGLLARLGSSAVPADRVRLGRGHVTTILASLAAGALLLERLGFVPTMSLVLLVQFRALSPLGWWRSGAAAVATAIGAWLFFHSALGVTLPG